MLTGASGFLGSIIVSHLQSFADVITLGRSVENAIQANITEEIPRLPPCDVVIHAAGKAHMIPQTALEKQMFMDVNFQGTVNLCRALEKNHSTAPVKTFVFISSVSVYGLDEGESISEEVELLGDTPYAKSKIKAESFLRDWSEQQGCNLVILRLPLIVGSNPVGNLAKLIEGVKSKKYLNIDGGKARKSMVLGEDVAALIGNLGTHSGTFNLTDTFNPSFKEVSDLVSEKLGQSKPLNIPMIIARPLGWIGDVFKFFPVNSGMITKMTTNLTFDSSKAVEILGWQPRKVLSNFDTVFK